ncbi:MAG: flagellar motor switch protein FliM [Bacillota bacterium]|nr:flagellar motor switch protein FliM [Bacillota bacterium]
MAEVLSQQQIDEILGKLQSGNIDIGEIEESSQTKVKEYDFLSPKRFSRDQLKLLNNIFENFARLFSLYLSGILRVSCEAEVKQVEEEEYREFNNALNDSVLIGVMRMQNLDLKIEDKRFLIEMSRPISFTILDRLLGGNGGGDTPERNYTDIEISLFEYIFKQIASVLKNAWGHYVETDHSLEMIQTNSRMIQFIQQDESVAIVVLDISVGDSTGTLNVCLPANALEDFFRLFNSKYAITKKSDALQDQQHRDSILGSISDSPLVVSTILGRTQVTLQDLLELQKGDILPLGTSYLGGTVSVNVENEHWFEGVIGVKKKNYAVKIKTKIH